jgi:hypothetical protein
VDREVYFHCGRLLPLLCDSADLELSHTPGLVSAAPVGMAPTGWSNPFPTYAIVFTAASYFGHRFFAAMAIAALPAVDGFAFGGAA